MYNDESDEDEQLLKKEHKGMIYREPSGETTQNFDIAPQRHQATEKF